MVVTVFPEIHHEQIDGLIQVGRLRRMGVAAGQQGPSLQAQVGQGFQFLLGQGQGLGKIPAAEIGFHGRHPHRRVPGLFHAQAVQEFQGLGTPLQVSQDPGLLQTGDPVLRGLLQGEIIVFQGFRQVAQPQVEMGLLPEEPGVFRNRAFLQFLGRLLPAPVLQQETDAPQAQIDVILDFQDLIVLAQGLLAGGGIK